MRVTNQMMASSVLANLNKLRSHTAGLTEQISSGNRISKASQDPTAGGEVMRSQSRLTVLSQWESNLGNTKDWVRSTDSALGDLTELLGRAKELALTAANDTLSNEARLGLAPSADQLLQELQDALNTQGADGGYLFGGFANDSAPFSIDPTTGAVTYRGDAGQILRDVGPGTTLTANVDGSRLGMWSPTPQGVSRSAGATTVTAGNKYLVLTFVTADGETAAGSESTIAAAAGDTITVTGPSFPPGVIGVNVYEGTAPGGPYHLQGTIGTSGATLNITGEPNAAAPQPPAANPPNNMLSAVWNLAQGLKTGDRQRISDTLSGLEVAHKAVVALRTEVGAREQRIEHLESRMQDTYLMLNQALEKAQGVDMEKAILDLTATETTYRAALQVGARVMPPSLADFLR